MTKYIKDEYLYQEAIIPVKVLISSSYKTTANGDMKLRQVPITDKRE